MSTELIRTEEVSKIIIAFPEIMSKNSKSLSSCTTAGQAYLDTISAEGMSEELDQSVAEYLGKVKGLITNMEKRRQPLTQMFDKIRSLFTSQEKSIDPKDTSTIPGKLVAKRNEYAAWKYQEEQRIRKEAEQTARIENEKATYKRDLGMSLVKHFNAYLTSKITELASLYNSLTLENFHRGSNYIRLFSAEYPRDHFDKFTDDTLTFYISPEVKKAIRTQLMLSAYQSLQERFRSELTTNKQNLIDRLSSKQQELHELEELRKSNAEAAAEAEAEKKRREQEETVRQMAELKQKEAEDQKRSEASSQKEAMNSLFGMAAASIAPAPSNAKVKEKIQVLHPAGFVEIYQMWWINEGQSLTIEELEKVHKKMITFCEKQANSKDPQHINSQYIRYEDDIKAK